MNMFSRDGFYRFAIISILVLTTLFTAERKAVAEPTLSRGQTLYVPAYSHVYVGDRALEFNLATTLSIRNTDPRDSITVILARYYNSNGVLVREMLKKPISLKPLASTSFFIRERDVTGGFGASFIVKWSADREVNAPVVEAVMVGARAGQGITFVGAGREIK